MNLKFWTWDLWRYRRVIHESRMQTCDALQREDKWKFKLTEMEGEHFRLKESYTRSQTELQAHRDSCTRMRDRVWHLEAMVKAQAVLRRLEEEPVMKPELLAALKNVTETTPLWRAIHAVLKDQAQMETAAVCAPAAMADYCRGRLAAIEDLKVSLLQHHVASQREEK